MARARRARGEAQGRGPARHLSRQLPVSARRDDLLAAIRDHQVVVVAGETGSGKTTQLPKICLELGRGVRGTIAHTQPRRLAARTVAERIADELKVPLGEAVGYAVRFSDQSREDTLLRLMTDGLLLAEIQRDRLLRRYDTIIIDEAHERSLNIDFLLGYLKRILPARPDLKVIITSATIDPERFAEHFDDAPIVEVSGRTYPVEVRYREPDEDTDQTDAIGDAVDELLRERPGDILVFLSGEREIRDTADALEGRLRTDVEILPLFARQSTAAQQRVWKPHQNRRVVLATNVAETSLTVPGIRYVVDPGTARISPLQRAAEGPAAADRADLARPRADQRKGRCGRTTDGIAIRLYSEEDFEERPRFTDPEILRTSLAAVILQMAAIDLGDVEDFPFLDPPDRRQVRDGIALLQELGALDETGRKLTPLGRRLAQLPVDPRMGRMVLEADRLGCTDEVIVIAAALSIQDVARAPRRPAGAGRPGARPPRRRELRLPRLPEPLALPARAAAASCRSTSSASRPRASSCTTCASASGRTSSARSASRPSRSASRSTTRRPSPRPIHQAILTGLLSHLGLRGRRPARVPRRPRRAVRALAGQRASRASPTWVMVSELVETSRLWGRTAARDRPALGRAAGRAPGQRTYDEPRWEQQARLGRGHRAGDAVRAADRRRARRRLRRARPGPLARPVHPPRAGRGRLGHAPPLPRRQPRLIEEVEALEERARRRDILVDDQTLYDFYAARIPETSSPARTSTAGGATSAGVRPDLLTFTRELLINPAAAEDVARPAGRRGARARPSSS